MTMGERIRELRTQHKLSMSDLGKMLGVGKSAIQKYENGEVENLPRSTIEKMATIFGVSPAHLMCFDDVEERLSDEVALIKRIQAKWGKEAVKMLELFVQMNADGKKALLTMAEDFSALDKYSL